MATTRRLLERLPDDRLDWRPHPRARTIGELASHLSSLPLWGSTILSDASFDLAAAAAPTAASGSRATILASFDEACRQTRAAMDKSDSDYQALWTLKRAGQQMFSVPRVAAFRSFVLHHLIHHRGQLSLCLRLLDIPVPAIYGPSADEGAAHT
jgi:uncharacterized damage-inducible protein DinB